MDSNLLDKLVGSMAQMNEIIDGERAPSREFVVDPMQVKNIRKATGSAKALLRAIKNDPEHVLVALAG